MADEKEAFRQKEEEENKDEKEALLQKEENENQDEVKESDRSQQGEQGEEKEDKAVTAEQEVKVTVTADAEPLHDSPTDNALSNGECSNVVGGSE